MIKKILIVSTIIGALNILFSMNLSYDEIDLYTELMSSIFYITLIINIICLLLIWNNKSKKNCPYCRKLIDKKAKKCPYCQSRV